MFVIEFGGWSSPSSIGCSFNTLGLTNASFFTAAFGAFLDFIWLRVTFLLSTLAKILTEGLLKSFLTTIGFIAYLMTGFDSTLSDLVESAWWRDIFFTGDFGTILGIVGFT